MASVAMLGATALGAINIVLAALLLAMYGRIYAKTKAPFTGGLIFFALAFLLENGLAAYSYDSMMRLVPEALAPCVLVARTLAAPAPGATLWTASLRTPGFRR